MRKNFVEVTLLSFLCVFSQPADSIHYQEYTDGPEQSRIKHVSISYGTNTHQLPYSTASEQLNLFEGLHKAYSVVKNQNVAEDPKIKFLFCNLTEPHHHVATALFQERITAEFTVKSNERNRINYRNYVIKVKTRN